MKGWSGRYLYVDLSNKKFHYVNFSDDVLISFIGGRGLAIKLLWDLNPAGVDPLSPENHLILAVGPLTGYPLPSSGKMVVASKSPLTGGYGDGNIGTRAAVELRRLGVDAVAIKGRAEKPTILYLSCDGVEFKDGMDYWGLTTKETEEKLEKELGKEVSVLSIGPAGERLVKYATVVSEFGRSAGRPGMGTVMGSKNLKAVVVRGCYQPEPANRDELLKLGAEAYRKIKESPSYEFWVRQGTMATIEWSQKNSVLPTYNFSEGVFDYWEGIDGFIMESMKTRVKACPNCNMPCGNVVKYVTSTESGEAELDYENVAMLGSNIGLSPLNKVAHINLLADLYGIDTISLGSVIGYSMELSEKGLLRERIEWGDYAKIKELTRKIAYREDLGDLLAEGVATMANRIGGDAWKYAVHVKGLEVSAYDCHAAPGMALAYATSPIGAHHKDAWFIATEIRIGRFDYTTEKVERLVWMQNVRGGMFESLVTCRLPWVEVSLDLDYYPKLLTATTGYTYTWDKVFEIANRIYTLIRSFWVREYAASGLKWSYEMDLPPAKWFTQPLTKGLLKGMKLDADGYMKMLKHYYSVRGWDERGIPRKSTLEKLELGSVAPELEKLGVSLS
ncbi:MAG: aldehyde ferredoxin oxidoreductase family protein [Sulfolobales archaeon]